MGQGLKDLTLEAWIDLQFDLPMNAEGACYAHEDWWAGPPVVTARYVTQAFQNAGRVFRRFSDAQLHLGFEDLPISSVLSDTGVKWQERKECILSVYSLFEQCFATRCTPHLSHRDRWETGTPVHVSPLNSTCYMWWDVQPDRAAQDDPNRAELDTVYLEVMRRTLHLPSIACQESALHGLGHRHLVFRETEVTKDPATIEIIDQFLAEAPSLNADLKEYALAARTGYIQ